MTDLDVQSIMDKALESAQRNIQEKPLYAEAILNQFLKAFPDHSRGLQLLGIIKQKLEQFDEAIKLTERAIELEPENPDNYNNLALSYANLDRFDKSIEHLNKAMELKPNNYLFINNLALQYRQIQRHDIALQLFERALAITEAAEIYTNMGGVYGELKDLKNAEKYFRESLRINPNFTGAHVDLAFVYQLQGDWKQGFAEYEWRFDYFRQLSYYKNAYNQGKKWDGQPLEGKRILLYGEQGLGDQIQFVRYCKLLKEQGAYVIVHCSELLESIFKRMPFVDETMVRDIISGKGQEFPVYDYQCSLMSLPHILGVGLYSFGEYIEPAVRFNVKDSEDYKDTFNVGICWAGSAAHPHDHARSTHLKYFQGLHDMPGVQLFNLQMCPTKRAFHNGKRIVDFAEGGEKIKLIDMTPMIQNFEDSATIISGLDLIITVDTALVHLAGAMGVPCWVLLPYNCDWRWLLEGETTEWYESVRLFRQTSPSGWESVFLNVQKALEHELSLSHQRPQLLEA